MMHLIFLCDGLPEGIESFKRKLDRHNFGNGGFPCRLREIKILDLQFDARDKKDVMALIKNQIKNPKHKDKLAYSLMEKTNPFRRGTFNQIITLFVKLFGWIVGAQPWETWKEEDLPKRQIPLWLLNVFPIAVIKDNFVYNKVHESVEEWL